MKKMFMNSLPGKGRVKNLLLKMKLTFLILLFSLMQVSATVYSQATKFNLKAENKRVIDVLQEIEASSDFRFFYQNEQVNVYRQITVDAVDQTVEQILDKMFAGQGVNYKVMDDNLILLGREKDLPKTEILQQQKSVSGKVTDDSGEPLPGVTVLVKGTTQGTVTNADGNYTITNIPDDAVLQFSFVGMKGQEIVVGNQTSVNVTMEEETIGLEEVVAVGYGTIKRTELTSSVTSVKSDDFVKGNIRDAAQLIKGQVAGLSIINPDANPTATSQIVLRGVTTLASGTQPLVVIDGVPGLLTDVAPEDIESIDILKDGSAAAIYGTRGTNGVILITTRKVKGETPATIEWNSYVTTQSITKQLKFMDAGQYKALATQKKPGAIDYGANTDWMDEIFQTSISHTHNVSFKGGSPLTNYIMNVNYKDLEGIMVKSDNNVLNARIEANHSMFDGKLLLNGNIMGYNQSFFSGIDGSSWRGDVYRNALIYNPTEPVKDSNGKWTERPEMNNYANPVSLIEETDGQITVTNFKPFGNITLYPIEGLTLKLLGSRDIYNRTSGYAESFDHRTSIVDKRKGFASRSATKTVNDLLEFTANYTRSYGKHNSNLLAGYSFQQSSYEYYWMSNYNFPSDQYSYNNMSVGAARTAGLAGMGSTKSESRLVSYFARGNYNYDNKYLLMVSLRYEGSTKFGDDHKWGAFPAVSAGWNIKNESFMSDFKAINTLKIRGGYGLTGTAPNDSYQSMSRLTYGSNFLYNGSWIPVLQPSSNPNPDLRWETKEEINLGLEVGFLDNRIGGSIDLYKRTTRDLLWNYNVSTPPYLFNTVFANAGTMENKGLELLINAIPVKSSQFTWSTSVNFSTNSNKLVSLSNEKFQLASGYFYAGSTGEPIQTTTHRVEEGQAIGNFYGFKSIDIDDNGRWIIEGKDGNPKPIAQQQPEDKKVLGNGLPKHYLNFNNYLEFKNFDLSISMLGAFGFQILNMTKMFYAVPVSLTRGNVMACTYDNIYGKRPLSDFQELQYVSYFIENGDYWKLDNLTVGYTLNRIVGPFKGLRFYASGSNLFTLTGYSGIDPEVNRLGLDPGNDYRDRYPATRTFTVGVSFKF